MNPQIERLHVFKRFLAVCLVILLLFLFPSGSRAQAELHADKQLFQDTTVGSMTLREGPRHELYLLNRLSSSSIWISDYSGTSTHRIVGGATETPDLRIPADLAVDREGNAIVADISIKVFSTDGKLLVSFPFSRPQSVGVLSDGRILVSGFPKEHLLSVFDKSGKLLNYIGEPTKADDQPFASAVLNMGIIVVDPADNIYYIFRFMLTPTIRKYSRDGKLLAEWHPQSADLDQVAAKARKGYERRKQENNPGAFGASPVFTSGAFDSDTNTLWIASEAHLLQLDDSGKTVRTLALVLPKGGPLQADGLLVDRDFIRAASKLHGVFEAFKPH
jgi:hypothetical protein